MIPPLRATGILLIATFAATSGSSAHAQDPAQGAHEAAWSPDSKRLVLIAKGASSEEVFIANLDGSNLVQITRDSFRDYYPAMSPDGRRIAYLSIRDSVMHIIVMLSDGSSAHDLGIVTAVARNLNPVPPNWSPDGKHLVYATTRNGSPEVFTVNPDGTGDTRLTAGTLPVWSHDGQWIAYSLRADSIMDLFVIRPDGSDRRKVTSVARGVAIDASWTPDDKRLVYTWVRRDPTGVMVGRFPKNLNDLHIVQVADGHDESLGDTPEAEFEPRVSPDGQWIVYLRQYTPPGASESTNVLFLRSIDGTQIRKVFPLP